MRRWLAGLMVLAAGIALVAPSNAQDSLSTRRGDIMSAQGATPVYQPFRLCPSGQGVGSNGIDVVCVPIGGGSVGTVTDVGNGTIGPLLAASWATATTTPRLSLNLVAQAANCVIAGPATGAAAVPTCRSLVTA